MKTTDHKNSSDRMFSILYGKFDKLDKRSDYCYYQRELKGKVEKLEGTVDSQERSYNNALRK
jgi:hypothetical protein